MTANGRRVRLRIRLGTKVLEPRDCGAMGPSVTEPAEVKPNSSLNYSIEQLAITCVIRRRYDPPFASSAIRASAVALATLFT